MKMSIEGHRSGPTGEKLWTSHLTPRPRPLLHRVPPPPLGTDSSWWALLRLHGCPPPLNWDSIPACPSTGASSLLCLDSLWFLCQVPLYVDVLPSFLPWTLTERPGHCSYPLPPISTEYRQNCLGRKGKREDLNKKKEKRKRRSKAIFEILVQKIDNMGILSAKDKCTEFVLGLRVSQIFVQIFQLQMQHWKAEEQVYTSL